MRIRSGVDSLARRSTRPAFTLVELLVVIGIIAVLIGVLLPALNRARSQANATKCMSNMRQIAYATIMFATEHDGWMPGSGSAGQLTKWDYNKKKVVILTGDPSDDSHPSWRTDNADWIAWTRRKDPITGTPSTAVDLNITHSGLTKYLGAKTIDHSNYDDANIVGQKLDQIYRCPADTLEARPSQWDASNGVYRYSYGMNVYYSNLVTNGGRRVDGMFNGRMSSIRAASNKILLVCEDDRSLEDAAYKPRPENWSVIAVGALTDVVAARHDPVFRKTKSKIQQGMKYEDAKGNVAFCDGHAEFFTRKDALRQKYTGSPTPDPATGF